MPAVVTLLYPAVAFDWDYYINKHMTLVQTQLSSKGLQKWEVIKLDPSSGNCCQCMLYFEKQEQFTDAMKEHGIELMADKANYTEGNATVAMGVVVGSG